MRWCTVALLAACADAPAPAAPRAQGEIRVVDSGGPAGDTGHFPALAVGRDGRVHLAYCDWGRGDVRYAMRSGAGFKIETVYERGRAGKHVALAVTPSGRVAVSFYGEDEHLLRYAERTPDGAWTVERVAWGIEVGAGSQLLFDDRERAHLFFYMPNGTYVRASRPERREGGDWPREVVAHAGPSLSARTTAVLHRGRFWLSFADWDFEHVRLMLARPAGAGTAVERLPLEDDVDWSSALGFVGDAPFVVYRRGMELRLAEGELWQGRGIARSAGAFAATGYGDEVLVAYEDRADESLKLLRGSQLVSIDGEGPVGEELALATDVAGRAVLAYRARAIRGLKLFEQR
jgi:hypothetical protein